MATFSEIEIEFLQTFTTGFELTIVRIQGGTTTNTWDFVASRTGGFEVTAGATTAETATNFKTAFDLDFPTGFETTVVGSTITIASETDGENFIGFSAKNSSGVLLSPAVAYNVTFTNFTPTVDVSNIDVALVRSPHYVSTNFNLPTTTRATIEVKVWSGDLDTPPASPAYTLTRVRPTVDAIDLDTNLSEIVRSQLKPKVPAIDIGIPSDIFSSNSDSVKWIQYIATFTDSQNQIPNVTGTFAALDGYGYHSQNANPGKPENRILLSNITNRQIARNGILLIPFVNDGYIDEIVSNLDLLPIAITDTLDSDDFVQYYIVVVSEFPNENNIDLRFNNSALPVPTFARIIIDIVDECKFTPKNIIFKNKFGTFESISMFKRSISSIDVKKEEFVNKFTTNKAYDVTTHQYRDINFDATEKISLNSGYVSEAENETFKQMLLSDQVFFWENNTLIPVNIISNSITFKDEVSDKLINYTMEFKYSYNTIQNV